MPDRENKTSKPLTIGDIADALGVSKTTVSRAISGKGRVSSETKARVRRYITEHHYTPSAIAKALAKSTTYNISVVLPGECSMIWLPFYQNCLNGIVSLASSMEYDVLITPVFNDDISQLQRAVANHKVDGVIVTIDNKAVIKYLKEVQIPFVGIDVMDEEVVCVGGDLYGGARELTNMLIAKGCKNIGLIGGDSSSIFNQKCFQGFKDAFLDTSMQYNEDLIYLDVECAEKTEQAVAELLRKKADCIVCMNDTICIYAINKIKAENIKISEDIKIASFYNSDLLNLVTSSITAIDFDLMGIGKESFKILYDMLNGRKIRRKNLLGYNVLIKDSTK